MVASERSQPVVFETHPSRYQRIRLQIEGAVARLDLSIPEEAGLNEGYALKLNSYDLGVDIELADAANRLRFEHPEVRCVVISSALEGCFCSGANIFMLGAASHSFKVNFCKFTNETRLSIEDATAHSDQTYIAAVNGVCSGGGYELALACEEIYLVDDRRSAVALPEVPYLGVLPGTGGLTRLVDKRRIRRDRADVFCTLAEGLKGKKAKRWGLVDDVFPSSRFDTAIAERAQAVASDAPPPDDARGVVLEPLEPTLDDAGVHYRHLHLRWGDSPRTAWLDIEGPQTSQTLSSHPDASWYPLRLFREFDDALLRLRFNHPEIGLVLLRTQGDFSSVVAIDAELVKGVEGNNRFAREVLLYIKRTLKRMDLTAKSFFALIDEGSCFAGFLLELALAADRTYMLEAEGVEVTVSPLNLGLLPMGNGLSRLATRLFGEPDALKRAAAGTTYAASDAEEAGLCTLALDELDWDDEIRLATEERTSLSPDGLTGMEASLRCPGPETLETKIFGRLSAWQNWVFQRPNAVGERGALKRYGSPESPEFDWNRT